MVKIIKKLLIFGLIFIFLIQLASALNVTKLDITNVDVTVDGKSDKDLNDGAFIAKEAKPGDSVKIKIKVSNTFSDAENLDIEDVLITAVLEEVDDGDDLEEESDEFDVKQGRTSSETLTFEIPKKVDEGEYNLVITVEGEDENSTEHEDEWTLSLEVQKEKHALEIEKASLGTEVLECTRTTTLELKATNYGRDDEEEVVSEIKNSALGLNVREEDIELSDDLFDEDSSYKKTVTITAPNTLTAGVYPIEVNMYYESDKLGDTKIVNLIVKDCAATAAEEVEVEETQDEIEVITPVTSAPKDETVTVYATPVTGETTTAAKETKFDLATYALIGVVGVIILVVVLAALVGVALILRRR